MIRDFSIDGYCNFLWISDLLALRQDNAKKFLFFNNKRIQVYIKNVTIFGTIIEVKQIGTKGFLYSVDDGTGVILCKHDNQFFSEVVDVISNEYNLTLQETESSRIKSCSFSDTSDDTVFNDRTFQSDEADAIRRNQMMGAQSMWSDILDSFTNMITKFNVGDTVFLHGKLYSYFNISQIYINTIRLMEIKEELLRIKVKLENNEPTEIKKTGDDLVRSTKKRMSGIITFDHVSKVDVKLAQNTAFTPKRKPDEELFAPRKRLSIVSPQLGGIITFDTFANFEEDWTDGNEEIC